MLSYMNLAVFALAACAVSPVLSAPTRYRAPREDSDVFRRFGSNSNSSLKADLARAYLKSRTKEWIAHHLPNAHTTALGVAGMALAAMVVKSFYQSTNDYNQLNQTAEVSKRMFEAFEGRANHAELVERALDHDLDKRFGLLAHLPVFFGRGTQAGVSKDVSDNQEEVTADSSALGNREVAPGDILHFFPRMLDELN